MKKTIISLILFIFIFMVVPVHAVNDVSIESIDLDSKSDTSVIVEEAIANNLSIKFNVKFTEVNDYVKYKIVINNKSNIDYMISENKSNSEFIEYEYSYDDNNKIIENNKKTTMYINIKYIKEVEEESLVDGLYNEVDNLVIDLGNEENPNTGRIALKFAILIILIMFISLSIYLNKKNKKYLSVLILLLLVPFSVYAIEKLQIKIENKIEIEKVYNSIYWAVQDRDNNGSNETLVISHSEVNGNQSGSFDRTAEFTSSSQVPWLSRSISDDVTNIVVESIIYPTSTAYWFDQLGYDVYSFNADLTKLKTDYVTNMDYMFMSTARYAYTWSISGIDNWNTSKVKSMAYMFDNAGYSANTWSVGDISNWDTSSVENMSNAFEATAYKAREVTIGDFSNWNTSKVTNMKNMFFGAFRTMTTFNFDFSKWNTSSVKSMNNMFLGLGYNVAELNIDISNWDTSNVTDMGYLFSDVGYNSTSITLDISNWNMSNVTNIDSMFRRTGLNATNWNVIIPKTNGNGINNSINYIYGKTSNVRESANSFNSGRSFTLKEQ